MHKHTLRLLRLRDRSPIIDFGRNVHGPIALGHSAHFDLGLFVPAKKDDGQ